MNLEDILDHLLPQTWSSQTDSLVLRGWYLLRPREWGGPGELDQEKPGPPRAQGSQRWPGEGGPTLPASPDHQLCLDLGRVQRAIFSHREGLMGRPIHKESDAGDLHVEDVVVPLLVTHLHGTHGGDRHGHVAQRVSTES